MSIDPLMPFVNATPLRALYMPANVSEQFDGICSDLEQLLRSDPSLARGDSRLSDLLDQTKSLSKQLQGMRHLGNAADVKKLRKDLLQRLKATLDKVRSSMDKLLGRGSAPMTQAATDRYGAEFAKDIEKIMSSNASLEDKLALLAGLMSDRLDSQIEDLMKQWTTELNKPLAATGTGTSGTAGTAGTSGAAGFSQALGGAASTAGSMSAAGGILGFFLSVGNAMAGAFSKSGKSASSAAGTAGTSGAETRDKQKIDQLQTQIQLLMDKKKNFMQMVSNLMAAESRTQNAIISNIRA